MAGPQNPAAAVGHGLRAGHADREQAIDTVKAAFVQGRLTKDELEVRVGQVLAAATCQQLAAVTADLPPGPATAKPDGSARDQGGQRVLRPGPVLKVATTLYIAVWVYAVFFPKGEDGPSIFVNLTFGGGFFYLIILATCIGQMIALRRARRSGGPPSASGHRRLARTGTASRHVAASVPK